ncbi:scavenger receptor cysteine-rich domain-containing group B protein isoform X3 [Diceros bicornis minor]|uniref:scavenger receptor cysteine-rich domain-containing group B protein isoform X3 n=1 Tax=Diceros bicornis minor TaxID=77932 RepID=UPI0026F3047D|nr:scavenger receptor cysteine-rich domain-containing group B protein isoform X3 [Diceros bicornis minor]
MGPSERPSTSCTHKEAEMWIGPQPDEKSRGWRLGNRSTAPSLLPPVLSFFLLLPLASALQPTPLPFPELRLVGGPSRCQGRLEVLHDGSWGSVCDDDWDVVDANVVCRQLGCGLALPVPRPLAFGQGRGPILLDNVECRGQEAALSECGSRGWGVHNCFHYEDVAVLCDEFLPTQPPTRKVLTSKAPSTNPQNGKVLGPPTSTALPPSATREDWAWHTEPEATGVGALPSRETALFTTPAWAAGKKSGRLRLVGGPSPCRGRVEVMYAGGWGTVCDDDWDFADARVACREAGCGTALGATGLGHFGYGRGPVLLDNVGCAGTETRLSDCFHLGWGQHNCGHHEDAGVLCSGPEELGLQVQQDGSETTQVPTPRPRDGHLRLANGAHQCEGRVELFLGQRWGTVCDDAWDLRAAGVLCRQLGCGQALAAPGEAHFGPGRGPILLDNVKCRGDESTLLLCSHIRWDAHNCDHSEDASVQCQLL